MVIILGWNYLYPVLYLKINRDLSLNCRDNKDRFFKFRPLLLLHCLDHKIFNRPDVAGAVLQTPLSLIN